MTDWPATASATFAGAGLLGTAWQLRQNSAERAKERRLGIDGVCASWHPEINPRPHEVDREGHAVWKYNFFVDNPGRFPISSIVVRVTFPVNVARVRGGHVDDPVRTIEMVHPVLGGGQRRHWQRSLKMTYADANGSLHATTATVAFTDSEGKRRQTVWPRPIGEPGDHAAT